MAIANPITADFLSPLLLLILLFTPRFTIETQRNQYPGYSSWQYAQVNDSNPPGSSELVQLDPIP